MTNPIRIQVSPKDPVSKNVDHSVLYVKMDDKRFFLERLANENPDKKILIFARTKVRAERVHAAMHRVDIQSVVIHGDKDQKDRLQALNTFKLGNIQMMIATDVSARGIDIPDVDFVVNYDIPEHPENYVHRVGRTGRGKNRGIAYSFCDDSERDMLASIEDYIGKKIKILSIDVLDYNEVKDLSVEKPIQLKDILSAFEKPIKKKGKKKK